MAISVEVVHTFPVVHFEFGKYVKKNVRLGIDTTGYYQNEKFYSTGFLGIDPGDVNMGLALFLPFSNVAEVYQITFPSLSNMLNRITNTRLMMKELLTQTLIPAGACVENAAYNAPFRQVQMAEHRTMAVAYLMDHFVTVCLPAPTQIRAKVFGSAKIKAEELWPDLGEGTKSNRHNDGASALACSIYAYLEHKNGEAHVN